MSNVTPIRGPLKIVLAKSQVSVETHMSEAGWKPNWRLGEPTEKEPKGEVLDDGVINNKPAEVARIRSAEIPWRVSIGSFDVGIVGTDCLLDHLDSNIRIYGGYAYGRTRGEALAYLGLFTNETSSIGSWDDVPDGTTIITERPHLTKQHVEDIGRKAEVFWGGSESDFSDFQKSMTDQNKLAIKIIEGAGAQQLQDDEILVMVGETGRRQRNYSLREIGKICDIETLVLINEEARRNPAKFRNVKQFLDDLDRVTVKRELEHDPNIEGTGHLSGERSSA